MFLSVLRQANKTFDRANTANFTANFQSLKQLLNVITYKDLHIQEALLDESAFQSNGSAPCRYVHIFENDLMSLSVFIVRSGYTMPLHDHPQMYGLLKCIYGQLIVQSYTRKSHTSEIEDDTINPAFEIPVIMEKPQHVTQYNECAELTPVDRNFHEMTPLDGVAAFFDILSPPYNSNVPMFGQRFCQFYDPLVERATKHRPKSVKLQCIPMPITYYCDTTETPKAIRNFINIFTEEKGTAESLH